MKNISIITIPVDYGNARKVCEDIESQSFGSFEDLRNHLELQLGVNDSDENQPQFFSISDFMDECNDQYINLDSVFISYVKIENL